MRPLAFALLLIQGWGAWSVRGTVRRAESDRPIAGALVEVAGSARHTWSNGDGAYVLTGLACAPCRLRFSAPRYDTAVVDVNGAAGDTLHVDVALTALPSRLPTVAVVAQSTRLLPGSRVDSTGNSDPAGIGVRRYTGADIATSPLISGLDPLRVLTASADVVAPPDIATTLHVRGGAADQNLVLLDGIPIYSPYHGSAVLSAVSPDFVDRVTLAAGVPAARYGNALSSTIAIDTRPPDATVSSHGGADGAAVRQTVAGPLPGAIGGFVVAGRKSTRALSVSGVDHGAGGFGDVAAKVIIGLPRSSLELLALGSSDRMAFDGRVADSAAAGPQNGGARGASGGVQNVFAWSGATQAAIWTETPLGGPRLTVRGWHSTANAQIGWAATEAPSHLVSALQSVGAAGEAVWPEAWGQISSGASIERIATTYRVSSVAAPPAGASRAGAVLRLAAAPLIASAFMEAQWHVGPSWSITTGMREDVVPGLTSTFEPRLSVRYALTPTLALAAGYARTQQLMQSARNEESILDAVTGVGLPVASGAGGVPVARADQLTAAVEQTLGARTTLSLDGYLRRLDGLLPVATVTAQPFAVDRLRAGTGAASGLVAQLAYRGDRPDVQVTYGLSAATRQAGDQVYVPSFEARHTVVAALGYRASSGTTLRGALWAASGRPTSAIGDAFEWIPFGPAGGMADLAGSPQRIIGPLDGRRLPPYLRLDLGVDQAWRPKLFGQVAQLTGRVSVTNVLNNANALGMVLPPGASVVRRLPLLPRSLAVSVEWAY